MEEEWMRDRARLRDLLIRYPNFRVQDYAQAVGRSISWVKKWRRRLREADPHNLQVLFSHSQAHHAPYGNLTLCLKSCGLYDRKSAESSNVTWLPSSHATPQPLPSRKFIAL